MTGPCTLCGRRAASWSDGVCSPCAARHPLRAGALAEHEHTTGVVVRVGDVRWHWRSFLAGLLVGGLLGLLAVVVP